MNALVLADGEPVREHVVEFEHESFVDGDVAQICVHHPFAFFHAFAVVGNSHLKVVVPIPVRLLWHDERHVESVRILRPLPAVLVHIDCGVRRHACELHAQQVSFGVGTVPKRRHDFTQHSHDELTERRHVFVPPPWEDVDVVRGVVGHDEVYAFDTRFRVVHVHGASEKDCVGSFLPDARPRVRRQVCNGMFEFFYVDALPYCLHGRFVAVEFIPRVQVGGLILYL